MFNTHQNGRSEVFSPLPPPLSPGKRGDEFGNDEGHGEESKLAEVPPAKRRVVRRPQPKLDSQRLTSEKGLPALRTLFDNVSFKGKGHEAEDVRLLMQKMENWAHRLYPKLQLEDFIDKVEKLGAKKEVQTCLKRIRLDMPLTHEDFAQGPAKDDILVDSDPFTSQSFHSDLPDPVHSTPAAPTLTGDQRQRMELNRQRALDRRTARLQQQLTNSQTADSSLQKDKSPINILEDAVIHSKRQGEDEVPANHVSSLPSGNASESCTVLGEEADTVSIAPMTSSNNQDANHC
ncbi:TIMELESS-interacting protein-like [Stigmatopora nigra]